LADPGESQWAPLPFHEARRRDRMTIARDATGAASDTSPKATSGARDGRRAAAPHS
jgi:hypothetical protein